MSDNDNKQLTVYVTRDELCEAANAVASSVSDDRFEEALRLYFIARYFVAIFESRYSKIPLQVWNEYRNAIDHFFRHLTTVEKDEEASQLKKMEGHLQRAALDILKIFSHETHDSIVQLKGKFSNDVLILIDNGNFIEQINAGLAEAEQQFEHAKVYDISLGEDRAKNKEVLGNYLEAAFKFDALRREIIEKDSAIIRAKTHIDKVHAAAHKQSLRESLGEHLLAKTIFAFGAFVFSVAISPWIAPYLPYGASAEKNTGDKHSIESSLEKEEEKTITTSMSTTDQSHKLIEQTDSKKAVTKLPQK